LKQASKIVGVHSQVFSEATNGDYFAALWEIAVGAMTFS
jgi:hypothetical protein